jgi:spore germination cell wall hydrolase CwlJ-like protein
MYLVIKKVAKKAIIPTVCLALNLAIVVGLVSYNHLSSQNPDPIGELIESLPESHALTATDIQAKQDLIWLARAVYFEARSEPLLGQYVVAEVVLNRVADPRWPDSIEAVVRQGEEQRHRCQFSFMCDGKPERVKDYQAWKQALAVAQVALEERGQGEQRITCAHSYHASYVTSKRALKWFAKLDEDQEIGLHKFYCD